MMNRIDSELQHELDLLVDGELPSDRWPALFAQFDSHPGAWKQLALCYLESQVMSTTLRTAEPLPPQERFADPNRLRTTPLSPATAPRGWLAAGNRARRLAMRAGTGLAAFALGWFLHGAPDTTPTAPSLMTDASLPTTPATTSPGSSNGEHQVATSLPTNNPHATKADSRLLRTESSNATPIEEEDWTPVVGSTVFELRNWWQQASAFPDDLRSKLQQGGHRIHRDIHLVPIATQGGGWGIVPIERLEISPASPAYSIQ